MLAELFTECCVRSVKASYGFHKINQLKHNFRQRIFGLLKAISHQLPLAFFFVKPQLQVTGFNISARTFQLCTAFDHAANEMSGGAVGLKMVCQVVFMALIPPEIEGIQELCVVHPDNNLQLAENYLLSCSILPCWLNCQEL